MFCPNCGQALHGTTGPCPHCGRQNEAVAVRNSGVLSTRSVSAIALGLGLVVIAMAGPFLNAIQRNNEPAPVVAAAPIVAPPAQVAPVAPLAAVAPVEAPSPATPSVPTVRVGPGFREVDSRMDDRSAALTQAQREEYRNSVSGTQVTWEGQVVEVDTEGGGTLTIKCNPKTWGSDTYVALDGSQLNRLASLNKGQRVVFRGILQSHGLTAYQISRAQFSG